VNQSNSVFATFNISQDDVAKLIAYKKLNPLVVEVLSETGDTVLATGKLSFIDNAINPQTGTILLKAKVANDNHVLWAAQMVNVKLILTIQKDALVIPSQAVKIDDSGTFVYLSTNNTATVQRIIVDRQLGNWTVVRSGLKVGDMVINVAPPNLSDGDAIQVVSTLQSDKATA
jgi:multidrug efflux system membrane fusion protein